MSNMKRMAFDSRWSEQPGKISDFRADGSTYDPAQDQRRLSKQAQAVWEHMVPGGWWTLARISHFTGFPESSISARLRDFRKPRFGSHDVQRRRRKDGHGTWEYRLVVNKGTENE